MSSLHASTGCWKPSEGGDSYSLLGPVGGSREAFPRGDLVFLEGSPLADLPVIEGDIINPILPGAYYRDGKYAAGELPSLPSPIFFRARFGVCSRYRVRRGEPQR